MDMIKTTQGIGNSYPPLQSSVSKTILPLQSTSRIAKTSFKQNDGKYEKTEKSISLDDDIYCTDFGKTIHGYEKIDKGIFNLFIKDDLTPFKPKQMEILIELVQVNSHITLLDISSDLESRSIQLIAAFLKTNTTLTSFHLSYCNVGIVGIECIADALKVNTSIASLNLVWNEIGDLAVEHIARALKVNKSITSLNLSWNDIGAVGVKSIADALGENTTLTSLHLRNNEIRALGAEHIAKALKLNHSLTSLNLSWNKIEALGAKHIAKALKKHKSIAFLDLGRNNIGNVGVGHIAKALKLNHSLTSLNLSWNKIEALGVKHIAKALGENTTLTSFNLSWNDIGDVGVEYIARALKLNRSITSLHLSKNDIGAVGAKCIARVLKLNRSITSLHLSKNDIGAVGAKCIADAMKENTTLTFIDFLDIQFNSIMNAVNKIIKRNEGYVSSLKKAVKEGNRSKVEELIKIGVSPVNRLGRFQSPFDLAMDKKNYPIIDLFLSKGFFFPCDPSTKDIHISVGKLPNFFKVINAPFESVIYSDLVDIILSYSFDTSSPRRYAVEIREKTDKFLSISLE